MQFCLGLIAEFLLAELSESFALYLVKLEFSASNEPVSAEIAKLSCETLVRYVRTLKQLDFFTARFIFFE